MSTINSVLALEDKMTKTLQSIERACESVERTMNQVDLGVQATDRSMTRATTTSNGFLKSLLGFSVIRRIFSLITNELDSAISRFDTMNNYPKVLENLGLSAEEATKSIDTMQNHLLGLPTRLDEATIGVQRFIAKNGNVQASTAMWLSMNDAILAGGAPEATRAAALEQLTQAYTKGKPEMQEWKSIQQAMPGQLKQIATAMGYVSTNALYDALKTGNATMNDFMKTMVQLDQEGIDGFANFHDQALTATDGIKTAITNMKTAVSKGLKDMIENVNTTLANAGLPTIQKMIENTGKTIQKVLSVTGTVAGKVIGFVANNLKWIKPLLTAILVLLGLYKAAVIALTFAEGIRTVVMGFQLMMAAANAKAMLANVNTTLLATSAEYQYAVSLASATVAQGGLAAAVWATLWPILAVIACIASMILYLHLIITLINNVTGETINTVGVIMGYLNVLKTFVYNRFAVPVQNIIATLVNFLANCFQNPAAAIQVLFLDLAINVLGYFTGLIKGIVDLINQLLEKLGPLAGGIVSLGAISGGVNISEKIEGLNNSLKDARSSIVSSDDYNEVIKPWEYGDYAEAAQAGYEWGSNLKFGFDNAFNPEDYEPDFGDLDLDSLVDNSAPGGKALKTTTKDKLISDEDIQLLLDVATRDYKLNYQKVEPNITITFGDVRETADVDDILDKVADKLEEIYDSDLEVVK